MSKKPRLFRLRISSVNATKPAVSCGWSHLLKKSFLENSFFVQWLLVPKLVQKQTFIQTFFLNSPTSPMQLTTPLLTTKHCDSEIIALKEQTEREYQNTGSKGTSLYFEKIAWGVSESSSK